MNRASPATGWVRNPSIKLPKLDSILASSYELGFTLNPITGCRNHVEGMCKGGGFPCYAYRLAHGRLKQRYLRNLDIAIQSETTGNPFHDPFWPRFWPERLKELDRYAKLQSGNSGIPRSWYKRKPYGIFVCDMSDLFGIGIPEEWTHLIIEAIKLRPEHRFYLLTKQPENLTKFSPFPDNCWVGVTVTNEGITYPDMMEQACRSLASIKASIKYISFEPLQSSIYKLDLLKIWGINWVIIGSQTRPNMYPKIEHVEEIVKAADAAGIPVFLKDNLKPLINANDMAKHSLLWQHNDKGALAFPLGIRQEMPVIGSNG